MAGGEGRPGATASVSGGDLDRLMQTEQRLQAVVAECEVEVARIRAAAQEAAEAARVQHEGELAAALQALEERVTAEGHAEVHRLESRYRAEKIAFDGISADQVAELAGVVIRRLLGETTTTSERGSRSS